MDEQLKILGNVIGDVLILLEQEVIGASENQFYIDKIRQLFDEYAEQFDEVLGNHKSSMARELKEQMQNLVIDLGKITG